MMEFSTWEPAYEAILSDFGYDRAGDERARDVLAALVDPFDRGRLPDVAGASVAVVGAGPSLPAAVNRAAGADAVFAASTAADACLDAGVDVDVMVTDLDKNPGTAADLTREDVVVAAHAHGDNVPAVREWVPRFAGPSVLPTTQAEPSGPVENFGGFTDGDRAAFLADALGAADLRFVGWDLDDPDVAPEKRRKLEWAARLLRWLERRRGERFAPLDGSRDGLALPWLAE